MKRTPWRLRIATVVLALLAAGCAPMGPHTVARDRFDYNSAIADSWKEQTLLNIVKIRYADMPLFVEVASVVSGYTLESSVNLGRTVSSPGTVQGDFWTFGGAGKYTDRPTITYAPITGQKFNESFLTPIPPSAILFLMQSGWSVDLIMPVTVDAINGLRSAVAGGANRRSGDAGYFRLISLMRESQKAGTVGMQIVKGKDLQETTVLFLHKAGMPPEGESLHREIREILGLRPDAQEISVTYGLIPKNDTQVAMLTRSLLQIMIHFATLVDVPPDHVADGRTISAAAPSSDGDGPIIKIESGIERPPQAFVAVNYRDRWFWIDDRDFRSKRTFAFLMILFSLMEAGGKEGLPLVTIPAS